MEDYCRPIRKASMFLALRPVEGFRDQYNAQSTAMSNIRKFVLRSLGDSEPSDIMEIPDELYLRRRVFTRGKPPALQTPRVPEKVIFYMRAGEGRVKRCSPYVFGVGDLVDVNSYVDVATYRGLQGSAFTKVYFSFNRLELVQLCPASSVKKMRRETPGTGETVS
ncbi:hypothetical protein HETIRDRAFT_451661 [Heterobasidion irregulare TC 32-1]|uniref:Uncharacterized protein n=1 Tax=Heterobasidion irregulare (strain TC 32-1) TaxID=747525 RepID=W4K857_HETIT|nr:uncharacterized protein HETIRDRAFT_451661 [Heterobasidion irregulare TC 32-1]ETW82012.1 hypothetical protein HETIRDRAFT_451661 [Heterobasidion irregulare TC 32-1]